MSDKEKAGSSMQAIAEQEGMAGTSEGKESLVKNIDTEMEVLDEEISNWQHRLKPENLSPRNLVGLPEYFQKLYH